MGWASPPRELELRSLLVRQAGNQNEEALLLSGAELRVGRTRSDIVVSDVSVSRDHALLQRKPEGWLLLDQGSRNGTFVNDIAIVRRLLREGDRVRFGAVEYTYHDVDEDSAAPLAPSAAGRGQEESLDAGERATVCLPRSGLAFKENARVASLVAVLGRFADSAAPGAPLEDVLNLVADDLQGFLGVERIVLHLPSGPGRSKACWIKRGASRSRPGVLFPEEQMFQCASEGRVVLLSAGRQLDGAQASDCDAVCSSLPAGAAAGFLYVEGADTLPAPVVEMILAAAEGLKLGLAIWLRSGAVRVSDPTTEVAPPLLVGRSDELQKSVRMAMRAAKTDSTVLLRGESGTGKELFAKLIYCESARRDGPFVPVHCSAIEETLMGSALFGHEKGAFTGAVGMKKGLFEAADKGTIFLDEIGELSHDMQVKLLRVLQEGEFMRVGGTTPLRVDVRLIAATNRDLEKAMKDGRFREDLYYRLKVIQLDLPPLRERRADIPDLVRHFMREIGATLPHRVAGISDEALARLQAYHWPGNIRELRNIVERALVLVESEEVGVDDLPLEAAAPECPAAGSSLDSMQRRHIQQILDDCGGNKRLAAQRLGISRSTLYEKLKESVPDAEATR